MDVRGMQLASFAVSERRPLVATRFAVASTVRCGDVVIDGTVGNGHDTELLARLVGRSGHVYGFDVQPVALDEARRRLRLTGFADRVDLFQIGHERMFEGGDQPSVASGTVRCLMFNLGYRPHGDKGITTRPETTIPALRRAIGLLATGGLITTMVYPGHKRGGIEADAVDNFVQGLDAAFLVTRIPALGGHESAAYAWHIRQRPTVADHPKK